MTTDTFQYDTSLSGTSIVIMNTKAEIQTALEEIAKVFEEKAGVHIEIMPVTDGDSPYTKVVSLYNSGRFTASRSVSRAAVLSTTRA